mgnify:CR=1 FL=1
MSYYISRLYDFLRELQANNNREWFAAHKEEYDSLRSLWLDDVDRLIGLMSQWEPQLMALKEETQESQGLRVSHISRHALFDRQDTL